MSKNNEALVTLTEMLQQEKWTRVAVANYTLAQVENLQKVVDAVVAEKSMDEARTLCKEMLADPKEAKKNISAQYVLGFLDLVSESGDDSLLIGLMDLFMTNHKPTIVEFIGERIIANHDDKVALRLLSKIYETSGQDAKKQETWEKLARIDLEDTESVRSLGLLAEANGKRDEAAEYYKKGIYRYIEARNFSGVREMWMKLLAFDQDFDLFIGLEKKIARIFDGGDGNELREKRVCVVLEDLYRSCTNKAEWDHVLQVAKLLLRYSPNNHNYRKDLITALREKYADNPATNTFLEKSHLTTNSRNVFEALEDFEKRIFFAKGNFVFHKTWNVGVISSADDENLVIDFIQKRGHSLSLSMAMEVLESLNKNDIRVYKAVWAKDKIKAKLDDVRWGVVTILNSYGSVSLKTMKAELYPSIFKENEWNNWSAKAKEILEKDAFFTKSMEKGDQFVMRSQSISFDEKKYMEFKTTTDFFGRYKIFTEFMKDSTEGLSSEYFTEMFSFFSSHLKTINKIDSEVLASYLIAEKYLKEYSFLGDQVTLPAFTDLVSQTSEIRELFDGLEVVELKRDALAKIFTEVPSWETYFSRIFPTSAPLLNKRIFELLEKNKPAFFKAMLQNIVDKSSDKKDAYFYLIRHYEEFKSVIKITSDQRLLKLLDLLVQTNSEILMKREATANKKLQKNILAYFFEEDFLARALRENGSLELCQKVFEIMREFPPLSVKQLMETQKIIKSIHKDFVFEKIAEAKPKKEDDGSFYTLLTSFSGKQRELQHLKEVEMPENSRQIGEAMALGDLKENAEYHSAKERQTLLTAKLNTLNVELDKAKVIDKNDIKGDAISFGTKFSVVNHLKKEAIETYSILGPWESDPDQGILSYKSPFGAQFLNAKVGDKLIFEINTHKSDYTVKDVEILKV